MKKLLLILLLLISTTTFADVALVVAIRGGVMGGSVLLRQGSEVAVGETIITAEKSFVVLQFTDGAKITVRPQTEMIVETYEYMSENDRAEIHLVSGGLRIITGAISKNDPDSFTLSTKTALMGVRGTEFSIQVVE